MIEDYEIENARLRLEQDTAYKHYIEALRTVLRTPDGKLVLCHMLKQCGTFEPAWTDKTAKLARQIVLKDFGNELLDDIAVADDKEHDSIQRTMRIERKLFDALLTENRV